MAPVRHDVAVGLEGREAVVIGAKTHAPNADSPGEIVGRRIKADGHDLSSNGASVRNLPGGGGGRLAT